MEPLDSFEECLRGLVGVWTYSLRELCHEDKLKECKGLSSLLKDLKIDLDEEIQTEELKHKQLIRV